MPRFFIDSSEIAGDQIVLRGPDAEHISRSLRMRPGEHIVVCDTERIEYDCVIDAFTRDSVSVRILSSELSRSEPPVTVTLCQALPKSDKLDFIIQKATELGCSRVIPFESERCVTRIDSDAERENKKLERRRRIAHEAAKQCGRALIPCVEPPVRFEELLNFLRGSEILFCYEGDAAQTLREALERDFPRGGDNLGLNIAVVVGSEGGFSENEARNARDAGARLVGLGPRILRCETAAVFALSGLAYHFEL